MNPDELPALWPCMRQTASGVVLDLSIVPSAKRTEMVGLHDGALRIRLAAPPVDGKASEALLRWLAAQLGLPRHAVTLVRGETGRRKQVRVEMSAEAIGIWLSAQLAP